MTEDGNHGGNSKVTQNIYFNLNKNKNKIKGRNGYNDIRLQQKIVFKKKLFSDYQLNSVKLTINSSNEFR